MDRQQILLAKSLEAAGVPLAVETFDERLILQKVVYLIQVAGVHTGYRYRWYLRGPYSPDMTADAFGILREGKAGQEELGRWNLDDESAGRLEKLKPLLVRVGEPVAEKARRLELLASVLFPIKTDQVKVNDHAATSEILKKNGKDFTTSDVRAAVKELKGYGLA